MQLCSEQDQLTQLQNALQAAYEPPTGQQPDGNNPLHVALEMRCADPGLACVVRFAKDGQWYRAKILSHHRYEAASLVEVYFVDYGNKQMCSFDMLRPITYDFFQYVPFAFRVPFCLDPRVLSDATMSRLWSDQFAPLTESPVKVQLMAVVVDRNGYCEGADGNPMRPPPLSLQEGGASGVNSVDSINSNSGSLDVRVQRLNLNYVSFLNVFLYVFMRKFHLCSIIRYLSVILFTNM